MSDKKTRLLGLSLLFLVIVVCMSCGCIETSSQSEEVGTTIAGYSVVEHEYLFGLMESKYDVRIWVLGSDVVDVQGITESELDQYLNQHT